MAQGDGEVHGGIAQSDGEVVPMARAGVAGGDGEVHWVHWAGRPAGGDLEV
jgi:hypothetical protein